jgi:hypothetical protein
LDCGKLLNLQPLQGRFGRGAPKGYGIDCLLSAIEKAALGRPFSFSTL